MIDQAFIDAFEPERRSEYARQQTRPKRHPTTQTHTRSKAHPTTRHTRPNLRAIRHYHRLGRSTPRFTLSTARHATRTGNLAERYNPVGHRSAYSQLAWSTPLQQLPTLSGPSQTYPFFGMD